MNKHTNNKNTYTVVLKKSKWFFISIFFILLFFINYCFYKKTWFIYIFITSFLTILFIGIMLNIKKKQYILSYINMLKKEIKTITWPKYQETLYTTFIVITVTIIMSFILWSIDNIIFRLIKFIIGLRF